MDKIEAIVEVADSSEILNRILTEFFNECTSNKMSIDFKQTKLKTILKSSTSKKIASKYQKVCKNPYLLLLKLLSNEELKGKCKEEVIEYFSTHESLETGDINNLCSALFYIPGVIEPHLEQIVKNHKKGCYLFTDVKGFAEVEVKDNTSIINERIKQLENNINNLNIEIDKIRNENNNLNQTKFEIEKENKSQKKKIKELEIKINKTIQSDIQKLNNSVNKYKEDLSLMTRDRDKYKRIYGDSINKMTELQKNVVFLENKLKNSYTEEELCISEDINQSVFIHTSIIGITKLVYGEIYFTKYNEIKDNITKFIDEISENEISIVYLETSQLSSYIISKIKQVVRNKSMTLRCIMFNSERELIEELAILKRHI